MYLFWSYANVKRTSRISRTTKKGEGGFFDSPVHVSLINILVAVWQRGKWLLSIRRSNDFNFSLRETISINTSPSRCASYITDIQLFSFSFVLLFDYSSCPTMSCLTFTRSVYVFLWFRTTYDDIKFSSWMKHQICMLIRSRKYPCKRSTYSCYYVVQLIILPKNQ